ncbi:MAG: type IV pilus biogenesis/stability protein PilW [Burkholderiaceae bacterium]
MHGVIPMVEKRRGPKRPAWRLALAAGLMAGLVGCATTGGESTGSMVDARSVVPAAEVDTDERRRARIRLELAAGYYQQRNYSVALDELRQALTIDPDYAAAYGMLGLVYMDLKETELADQSFRKALNLMPANAELNNNYGWFLCRSGRQLESLPYFEKAAADPLYQTPARPLYAAGICMRQVQDEEKALAYLHRAFQVEPGNAVTLYNLADIYLVRKDADRAHFYSQRLLRSYQPTAQTLWQGLRVARLRDDSIEFESLASQLRRGFPASPEASLLAEERFGD